jgi:hypothetical protein
MQLIIYTAWNIWKERCRRIFDNKSLQSAEICANIRTAVASYHSAILTEGE